MSELRHIGTGDEAGELLVGRTILEVTTVGWATTLRLDNGSVMTFDESDGGWWLETKVEAAHD